MKRTRSKLGNRPKGSKKYQSYQDRFNDRLREKEANSVYRNKYMRWKDRILWNKEGLKLYFSKEYVIADYRRWLSHNSYVIWRNSKYLKQYPGREHFAASELLLAISLGKEAIHNLFRHACKHQIKHLKNK